ncbi:MAG: dethiobiotin synthase [Sphingobacteriales bacterium]|nr:MAG: dethiobiotin synthase [Sphingobacteriales bacterium]
MKPIFITGIGTDVGKTLVSAIVTEALQADYWKPIQAGFDQGTDANYVRSMLSNTQSRIVSEVYMLRMPASPHIAAREEKMTIQKERILAAYQQLSNENDYLVIEGAGGLLVPLADDYFVADLIRNLEARVVIVSRNYLGSINHSLLTAKVLKDMGADVAGWIFNDQYLQYEEEIVQWSGYPRIGSIPRVDLPDRSFVQEQARRIAPALKQML